MHNIVLFFIFFIYWNQNCNFIINYSYMTPFKLNFYLFFNLPSAFWCGVRALSISKNDCQVMVRYKWFNKNPFRSMYFAVQMMAAELTTGALIMLHIRENNEKISMLVISNKSSFYKKATGKVIFKCIDGKFISEKVQNAILTKEAQVFWLKSVGIDQSGEQISEMEFEWSIKIKQ